jgi:pyrroloquinoline quinone biosynthesis protein B
MPVDGVFLTHAHIGHYLGLAFFGYEAIHTRALPVMATPRMADYLRMNGPWSQLVSLGNIKLEEMAPGDTRVLGEGVTVTAFSAPHRDEYADTLGFVISGPNRRLFYLPDTDSWTAWTTPLPEALRNIDIALVDGTFFSSQELPGRSVDDIGHPLIQHTLELLSEPVQQGGLEVYFTHLNHSNPALDSQSDERQEIESQGFHVLDEGQEFEL